MAAERDSKGRFLKGHAPSSPGRPRGLRERAQSATGDGAEIIALYQTAMRDAEQPLTIRLQAAAWLADRGWGRPVQSVEHSGPEGRAIEIAQQVSLTGLSDEELAQLDCLLDKASANAG